MSRATVTSSVKLRPVTADPAIAKRVGWLLDLIHSSETALLQQLWTADTFDVLRSGVSSDGRALPAAASVVAQRLRWLAPEPSGCYLPQRVKRVVQSHVISSLRTLLYRDTAIVAQMHGHGGAVTPAYARGAYRQLGKFFTKNPDQLSNGHLRLTDIQSVPKVSRRAQLGAADQQLARLDVRGDTVVLSVKLPTVPLPTCLKEWEFVDITAALPPRYRQRIIAKWCLPELTLDRKGPLLRYAFEEEVPTPVALEQVTTALGIDWSPSAVFAAATVTTTSGGLVSDFRGLHFDDRGLKAKNLRLQRHGELLYRKAARIENYLANADPVAQKSMQDTIVRLREDARLCGAKRSAINAELGRLAGNHAVGYALEVGAQAIGVENLSTLEAENLGDNNNLVSQAIRSKAIEAITHAATQAGLHVIEVPARGTSARCPGCDTNVLRPRGYHSARCATCGWVNGNRDVVGGVNVGKRALLGKGHAKRQKGTTRLAVRVTEHAPVTRCRKKIGPTPSRPRHRRVRHTTSPELLTERKLDRELAVSRRQRSAAKRRARTAGKVCPPAETRSPHTCQQLRKRRLPTSVKFP
jgi:hypothetical protein